MHMIIWRTLYDQNLPVSPGDWTDKLWHVDSLEPTSLINQFECIRDKTNLLTFDCGHSTQQRRGYSQCLFVETFILQTTHFHSLCLIVLFYEVHIPQQLSWKLSKLFLLYYCCWLLDILVIWRIHQFLHILQNAICNLKCHIMMSQVQINTSTMYGWHFLKICNHFLLFQIYIHVLHVVKQMHI